MEAAGKGKLIPVAENLVDKVWGTHRPSRPENPVFVLPDKFTGSIHSKEIPQTDGRQTI